MEIIVGKTAGFCFGVKNAVTKATEELGQTGKAYCLGELVHNKQVTEELENKGMIFIDNLEEAKGTLIIRSHGVPKKTYKDAENKHLSIIDLTCPKVLHIHNIVEEYAKKNYYIIIVGKKDHPEMIGTLSFCGQHYYVIENETDIEMAVLNYKKSRLEKLLIVSQTTFSMEKFENIVNEIKKQVSIENIDIKNTICNATRERQEETEKIAKQVDVMIIVGGKNSSNSTKLYELSKKYCQNVLFIETEKELQIDEIKGKNKVGIMAGASTPQRSIQEVVEKLEKIC